MADTKKKSDKQQSGKQQSGGQQDGAGGGEKHEATVLERIVGLAGAAIVLAVIGFMLHEAIWGERSPPDLEVELVRVVPSGDDYLAEIRVENRGGDTAAAVTVTGRLVPPGVPGASQPEAERATAMIDYVPPASEVRAGLFFDTRPTADTLQLSADGYVRP